MVSILEDFSPGPPGLIARKGVSGVLIFHGALRLRSCLLKMGITLDCGSLSGSGPVGNCPTHNGKPRPGFMLSKAVWGGSWPPPILVELAGVQEEIQSRDGRNT